MVVCTQNPDGAGGTELEAVWCEALSLLSDFYFSLINLFLVTAVAVTEGSSWSQFQIPLGVGCFAFVLTNNTFMLTSSFSSTILTEN